nr:MAG TPA: hypothetical protein [Caudoviricetes sp.]
MATLREMQKNTYAYAYNMLRDKRLPLTCRDLKAEREALDFVVACSKTETLNMFLNWFERINRRKLNG